VSRGLAVIITAACGGLIALQAPINSHLGKRVGTFQAAFVSFAVGTILLLAIASFAGTGFSRIGEVRHVAWYYLIGGLLGAAYVTAVLVTVRTLGAGGVTAATIAGQLTAAVIIDQLGILGLSRHPIDAGRIGGIALLAAGVYLIVRD
jgi:transporter family-2 protein